MSGLAPALCGYSAALKSRCHCFQVLSCRIAVVSSWQDRLHKPRATWAVASVERCSFVRLNAFQRNRVLGLCRHMHCQGTETDNSHSYQHSCDYTYGGSNFDVFHNSAFISTLDNCQSKSKALVVSLFVAWVEVSRYRVELSVALVADRPVAFSTELDAYERSRVRLGRSSEAISVRVNRRLLRSADRLVTGPIADEGASSRS